MALQSGGDIRDPWPPLQDAVDEIVFTEKRLEPWTPGWAARVAQFAVTAFAALRRLKVDVRDLFGRVEELERYRVTIDDVAAIEVTRRIVDLSAQLDRFVDVARLH